MTATLEDVKLPAVHYKDADDAQPHGVDVVVHFGADMRWLEIYGLSRNETICIDDARELAAKLIDMLRVIDRFVEIAEDAR